MSAGAPQWLIAALSQCAVICPGCGPLIFSARLAPVNDLDPGGLWDWQPVAHHLSDRCIEGGDLESLTDAILSELARVIMVGDYLEPAVMHTSVTP